jgi:hypothetical protein
VSIGGAEVAPPAKIGPAEASVRRDVASCPRAGYGAEHWGGDGLVEGARAPLLPPAVDWVRRRLAALGHAQRLTAVVAVLAAVAVVAYQPDRIGFVPGHHGWISSESLAMITRATPGNGFVGYVLDLRGEGEPDGRLRFSFDRNAPVLFALMHAAIAPWSADALAQIRLARAFMLGVFLLTAFVCQRLAALVLEDPVKATAAALLTTSGSYFMHYKDMVDFAQPGVLAMLVLMLAIGRRLRDRCGDRQVLAAAILAASFGVGLPSVAVAGSWFGCEAVGLAARRVRGELGTRELARRLAASTAWRAIALGGVVAAAWLVYCTTVEMVIRDVSLERTSIFDSVMRRAGLEPNFLAPFREQLRWGNFHHIQTQRFDTAVAPHGLVHGGPVVLAPGVRVVLYGAVTALAWRLWARSPSPARLIIPVCALFGPVWIYGMRWTTHFHDYFAITYGGTILMMWTAALAPVPRRLGPVVLAVALMVFGASARSAGEHGQDAVASMNARSADLARIRRALPPGAAVHVEGGHEAVVPGAPFALGFFLSGAIIHPLPTAPYLLTQDAHRGPRSLTPGNSRVFLLRREP